MPLRARLYAYAVLCLSVTTTFLLTGCGARQADLFSSNGSSEAMQGRVMGGQQPISGATITVWQAGTSGYGMGATQLASTLTDAHGNFQFANGAYLCQFNNAPVYITASGGDTGGGANGNSVLASGLGICSTAHTAQVDVNEVTTAATAFALSHFFTSVVGGAYSTDLVGGPAVGSGTYNAGLVMAMESTIPLLVDASSGRVNPNTSTTVIESAKIYSIANTLAACINTTGETSGSETLTACGKLFGYTTPPGGTRPADTFQAAVQMALRPYQNVALLYNLAPAASPFSGLAAAPNDWTIGVSFQSTGFGLGINGTSTSGTGSNIDIDASGRVWFPTNTAVSHGVAYFDPSSTTFNGPYLAALQHPQYLAITMQGNVYGSDLANNLIESTNSDNFFTTGFTGPIAAIRTYSFAADAIYYSDGGTSTALGTQVHSRLYGTITFEGGVNQPANSLVGLIFNSNFYEYASTSGSSTTCDQEEAGFGPIRMSTGPCLAGGAAYILPNDLLTTTSTNLLCSLDYGCFKPAAGLSDPQSVAEDGDGAIWIANAGNGSLTLEGHDLVSGFFSDTSPVPYLHDATHGNTMTKPYGLAIDGSGNVWTSNAGCVDASGLGCVPGTFVLSEVIGVAAPTITPLANQVAGQKQGTRP